MGYGDDLLITAFAATQKKLYPNRQIVIGNTKKRIANHSEVFDNNPNIADCRNLDKNKDIHVINYHSGNRPYIDYLKSKKTKYVWSTNFKPNPGEIYFSAQEHKEAEEIYNNSINFWKKKYGSKKFKGTIFLETSSTKVHNKQLGFKHINKDWGHENWKKLINKIKDKFLIIHSVHENTQSIENIFAPKNINFRLACAIMNKCHIYLGPEGGFGHVAAALRKKAVIYFGGWITPDIIGYDFHNNVYFNHPSSPCGVIGSICEHCNLARKKISVETMERNIETVFEKI